MASFSIDEGPAVGRGRHRLSRVIDSYDDWLVRSYCWLRFAVIPLRFLEDMGQFLPRTGRVLDIGCGFGLFSLYFASSYPDIEIHGLDLSARRVAVARRSARRLGLPNVHFECGDARLIAQSRSQPYDAVFTLDVLHHLSAAEGSALVGTVFEQLLAAEGTFVIKDVTTRPRPMLWFTYLLDAVMNPGQSFHYRSRERWLELLRSSGFNHTESHHLWDLLPYPHILIIGKKDGLSH